MEKHPQQTGFTLTLTVKGEMLLFFTDQLYWLQNVNLMLVLFKLVDDCHKCKGAPCRDGVCHYKSM